MYLQQCGAASIGSALHTILIREVLSRIPAVNELERVSPIVTFPRVGLLLALLWLFVPAISAQQESPAARAVNGKIYLDVVVTAKSGPPVTGLQQKDFTVLDNKAPQTIDTFKALGGSQAPIEVILVVDEVNADFRVVGFERDQIAKYLGGDGGRLAFPTALSFFSDTGVEVQPRFLKRRQCAHKLSGPTHRSSTYCSPLSGLLRRSRTVSALSEGLGNAFGARGSSSGQKDHYVDFSRLAATLWTKCRYELEAAGASFRKYRQAIGPTAGSQYDALQH